MEAVKKALVPFVPPPLRFSPSELGGLLQGALHPRRWATRATYDALRHVINPKVLLFVAAFALMRYLHSEMLFVIFFGFYLVASNLGDGEAGSGSSAYNIFNQGMQRLAGTFDGAYYDRLLRNGGGGAMGGGGGGGGGGAPMRAGGMGGGGGAAAAAQQQQQQQQHGVAHNEATAAMKWVTSHDVQKKKLRPGRDDVLLAVREHIAADLAALRALPQDTFIALCGRFGLDPFGERRRSEHMLAIMTNPEHYITPETMPFLEGYGLNQHWE